MKDKNIKFQWIMLIGYYHIVLLLTAVVAYTTKKLLAIVIAMMIFIVIGIILTYKVVQGVIAPIQEIAKAIRKLTELDLEIELKYQSENELGALAHDIKKLVLRLKRINRSLNDFSEGLSKGNLTVRIESPNEYVGELQEIPISFDTAVKSLQELLLSIQNSAGQVERQSSDVFATVANVSNSIEDQQKIIIELLNSAGVSARTMSDNSKRLGTIEQGCKENRDAVQTVNESTTQTITSMADLSHLTEELHGVTESIKDIAYKADLLALNGEIEAAHAGENGKTFSIVANNIKNLASDVSDKIEKIQKLFSAIVSLNKVTQKAMHQTGVLVQNVTTNTDAISRIVSENAEAQAGIESLFKNCVMRLINELGIQVENSGVAAKTVEENCGSMMSITQKALEGINDFHLK